MSNLSATLPTVTGYDYVGDAEPTSPDTGETWFDTGTSTGKVWAGSQWIAESAPSAGTALTLSGGSYDVSGVSQTELSFDAATQADLNNHIANQPVISDPSVYDEGPIIASGASGGPVTLAAGETKTRTAYSNLDVSSVSYLWLAGDFRATNGDSTWSHTAELLVDGSEVGSVYLSVGDGWVSVSGGPRSVVGKDTVDVEVALVADSNEGVDMEYQAIDVNREKQVSDL